MQTHWKCPSRDISVDNFAWCGCPEIGIVVRKRSYPSDGINTILLLVLLSEVAKDSATSGLFDTRKT